jgi:2'-5' RNA ligase
MFGRPERARVIWLALDGDTSALADLAARADQAARASVGLEASPAPSTPHLTLARVRERASREARAAIASAVEASATAIEPSTAVAVRRIALVRSHLEADGPRYEVLSRHGGSTDDREAAREVDAPEVGA